MFRMYHVVLPTGVVLAAHGVAPQRRTASREWPRSPSPSPIAPFVVSRLPGRESLTLDAVVDARGDFCCHELEHGLRGITPRAWHGPERSLKRSKFLDGFSVRRTAGKPGLWRMGLYSIRG